MKKRREVGEELVLTSLLLGVVCCALVLLVRILGKTFGKTMPPIPVSNDKEATSGGTPLSAPALREDCRDKFVGDADVAVGELTEDRRRTRAVVRPRGEERVLHNSPEEVREGESEGKNRVTWG